MVMYRDVKNLFFTNKIDYNRQSTFVYTKLYTLRFSFLRNHLSFYYNNLIDSC